MNSKNLFGGARIVLDAIEGVVGLVEAVHMTVLDGIVRPPTVKPVRVLTQFVYRSIGAANRLAGQGLDRAFARIAPVLPESARSAPGPVRAAVNGVIGDYLERSGNDLSVKMQLSPAGATGRRVAVMMHGLCMSGAQWMRAGVDHGAMLAAEKGYVTLYLDYNSGRHVSDNGRDFAKLLQTLADRPEVEEIVVVAHSMGGLVLRSALLQSEIPTSKLSRVVFLGTPHLGAPLERAGNWVNTVADLSDYSAPFSKLAKLRSAGITDLRHGSIAATDWFGRDRFAHSTPVSLVALPDGINFYAIAGVLDKLNTDGLVPRSSALGRHPHGNLQFCDTATLPRTGHMALLSSSAVTELLKKWL